MCISTTSHEVRQFPKHFPFIIPEGGQLPIPGNTRCYVLSSDLKMKSVPMPCRHTGGLEVQLHVLTLVVDGYEWSAYS
jgi:hypothetical protein